MKGIKQFSIRATKRGKTRGRPSIEEWKASAYMSYVFNTHRKEIEKKIYDMMIFGSDQKGN